MEALQHGDPGRVGDYRLLGRLEAGGMGQVFLGVSPGGRRVAVKLIHPVHAGTEHFRERFAREIEAARRVGGYHTAPVVDADPHAETPWMVTAYIDGPSLQAGVGRYGPLPPGQVRALGAGLAEGLAAIHAHGLVHRDLKPGNVIMAEDGPRIIDFGIARAVDATRLTTPGSVVGTFAYMSPEQVRGEAVMPASDVFSLGSVLAFAATGRAPFGSDTAATVMFRVVSQPPDLAGLADEGLRALIEACLAKSPADRPQVQAVLAALTGRGPVPAPVVPRTVPAADGRDAQTQPHRSLRTPAGTDPGPDGLPARSTIPPAEPVHARPAGFRPRRRPAVLIAAAVVVAVLGAVIPVLLTTGTPGTAAGHGLILRTPHYTELNGLAFSPNGKLLVAGDANSGSIYVWNVATGRLTATITGPHPLSSNVDSVAISPNGKFLADTDNTETAYLWNFATDKLIGSVTGPSGGGYPDAVAFSPDSKLLATGENFNQTDVWDVATRRLVHVLRDASAISGVAFSPDGKLVAAAGGPTFLWDVATGRRVAALYDPGGQGVDVVAFSPDGTLLAAAAYNGRTYLWNVATDTVVATLRPPRQSQPVSCVAFSPDGKLLATISGDYPGQGEYATGQTYLWDVATGKRYATLYDPVSVGIGAVAFSPDSKVVAAADNNGSAYLWDVAAGTLIATLTAPGQNPNVSNNVTWVTFSPDGRTLAICDLNGTVYVRVTSQLVS